MSDARAARFQAGTNIAMKVPSHAFAETVRFYREVVGLPHNGPSGESEVFAFGSLRLWIDPMPHLSQAEVWLELRTEDPCEAAEVLHGHGTVRCDGVEALPDGFPGFWILNPAGIVHLVAADATQAGRGSNDPDPPDLPMDE